VEKEAAVKRTQRYLMCVRHAYVYNGYLAWYKVLLITLHSSVEYSQLRYMLKSHYVLCLLSLRCSHGYNVRVGWLLTSQILALCPS